MDKRKLSNMLLILTALIWGSAFVAQSIGMEYIGPFTFGAVRSILGGLTLLPSSFSERKSHRQIKRKQNRMKRKKKMSKERLCWQEVSAVVSVWRSEVWHSRSDCNIPQQEKADLLQLSIFWLFHFWDWHREKSREKSLVRCYFGRGWNVFPLRKRRIFYFKGRLDHFGRFFRFCGTHSCDRLFFAESGWSMSFVSSVFYLRDDLCHSDAGVRTADSECGTGILATDRICGVLSSGVGYTLQIIAQKIQTRR